MVNMLGVRRVYLLHVWGNMSAVCGLSIVYVCCKAVCYSCSVCVVWCVFGAYLVCVVHV